MVGKRAFLGLTCVALLAVACGGTDTGGVAGETPIPPQTGGASSGGGPSITITVSGAVTGSTTQLATDHANHCSSLQSAETIAIYSMNLYPVVNGHDYQLSVIVAKFHGPVTLNVPADNADGRITVLFDDLANVMSWGVNASSTGTIGIDANGGGHLDLKHLPVLFGTSTLDISGSWTC